MPDDLTLLGVASNGTVKQWDGLPTVKGILLRWFQGDLGFPEYGYDIYRAQISDHLTLDWSQLSSILSSRLQYTLGRDVTLSCPLGFAFQSFHGVTALSLTSANPVTFDFLSPAWLVRVELAPVPGTDVTATLYSQGRSVESVHLTDTSPRGLWRTRGVDRLVLSGQGACLSFVYDLISRITSWTHLTHLCLPVTDPEYAGGSKWSGSDEDEARRRLPPGVDWRGKYGPAFRQLYPTLRDLAVGRKAEPLPPSSDPSAPQLTLSTTDAVQLAALNPHIARMLGLAYDDPLLPNGLDGREYAYRVTGRWNAPRRHWEPGGKTVLQGLGEWGFEFNLTGGRWLAGKKGTEVILGSTGNLEILWQQEPIILVFSLQATQSVMWSVRDENGAVVDQGRTPGSIHIRDPRARSLRIDGPAKRLEFLAITAQFKYLERNDVLPILVARDPGPPTGPQNLNVDIVSAPGCPGKCEAHLLWELPAPTGAAVREFDSVFYQVAALQIGNDPEVPAPPVPSFSEKYLLRDGDPIVLPPGVTQGVDPCYFLDSPLPPGWRCWWVRGIDLFGRVSLPALPVELAILDNALPPAPPLLLAEYVQGALSPSQQVMAGYSAVGRAWLTTHPGNAAVIVSWGWPPELAQDWPDVDGYRIQVRRPLPVSPRGSNDPEMHYPNDADDPASWGPVRAEFGPLPASFSGQVLSVTPGIPNLTITAVQTVDDTHAECQTSFNLDVGQGALLGLTLSSVPSPVIIVGHGAGPNITLTVEHPVGQPPAKGTYACEPGTSRLLTLDTTIKPAPLTADPFQKRWVGALEQEDSQGVVLKRWAVLSAENGRFLCLGEPPAAGDTLTWFPAYLMVVQDQNFGPATATDQPVAYAQVTVRSVREIKGRALQSRPGKPGTLIGVDCTPPTTPTLPILPTGPYCAQLATRADWYGISRFTLDWVPAANSTYMIYRALSEAVFALDREAHREGANALPHPFPGNPGSVWPADVLNEITADANRTQIVQTDFAQLDATLATGVDKAIRSAYEALHADTQRLLAGQGCAEPAYAARNKVPLEAGQVPFTDELDGKSRAHWFYRVAARSLSGLESAKSSPTPPICCPDVVPPSQPLVLMALAAPCHVRLQWQAVPDDDLAHYRVYRAADEVSARDVRSMQEVAQLPNPDVPAGHPTWREYLDPAPGGRVWFYRIVAEDTSCNRSQASELLKGQALLLPPDPPVWNPPVRTPDPNPTKVLLSWTVNPVNEPDPQDPSKQVPKDPRFACLLERRAMGSMVWMGISGWLPRGIYSSEDTPPDITLSWEYRVRIRDHFGQPANVIPTTSLAALP